MIQWHSEWVGDYDLEKEKVAYCKDDVKILAFIMEAHHESMMSLHGLTPWVKPTSPGYITECVGIELTRLWQEGLPEKEDPDYFDALQELATTKSWTALTQWEYRVVHPALRGGRTEVKCLYRQLTNEEKDRGCKIVYVDVVSLYPYQQVVHPNFVGIPTVYYWDRKYHPCYKHLPGCRCGSGDKLTPNFAVTDQWPVDTLREKKGIFVITLSPNKRLIHPVLSLWNDEMKKCLPSLRDDDHVEITIDHVSLKDCLDAGYSVVRVHCFLEFVLAESLWRDPTMQGVVEKTINSASAPLDRFGFIDRWDKMFPGIGAMFEERWHRWGKHPALKQASKIKVNSMWGKHAERANLPTTNIFDLSKDRAQIDLLWMNILQGNTKMLQTTVLNRDLGTMYYKTEAKNSKLDLHKGYLPAALMIPAYGRSQLWNQMHKVSFFILDVMIASIHLRHTYFGYHLPNELLESLLQYRQTDISWEKEY